MTGIDHILDAIDASLDAWDDAMPDAMHASYSADPLPPVEERQGGTTPWANIEGYWYAPSPDSAAGGIDVSGWREAGYSSDTPIWAGTSEEAYAAAAALRTAEQRFRHEAWMSMLMYGSAYIEHSAGEARVLNPATLFLRHNQTAVQVLADGTMRAAPLPAQAEMGGLPVAFLVFDEAAPVDPETIRMENVVDRRLFRSRTAPRESSPQDRALIARRNRHTGPQRNPHRHRGL